MPSPTQPAGAVQAGLLREYLIISAIIVVPLILFMVFFGFLEGLVLVLLLLVPSGLTLLVWKIFTPRIVSLMIHGIGSKSKVHSTSGRSVLLVHEPFDRPLRSKEILRRSLLPLLFVFGVSTTLSQIQQKLYGGTSVLGLGIFTIVLSILIWPTVSVFVVPVSWVLDGLGVRYVNRGKRTVEPFRVSSILLDSISVGTLISFFYSLFSTSSPEGIGYNVGILIVLVWMLFPPAVLITALYHRFSISNHVLRVYQSFSRKGAAMVRWQV